MVPSNADQLRTQCVVDVFPQLRLRMETGPQGHRYAADQFVRLHYGLVFYSNKNLTHIHDRKVTDRRGDTHAPKCNV